MILKSDNRKQDKFQNKIKTKHSSISYSNSCKQNTKRQSQRHLEENITLYKNEQR